LLTRADERRDERGRTRLPGLLDAGETIDTACENCHLKYWYPLDQQAQKAKEGAGSVKKS